jgi:hypothetical protein
MRRRETSASAGPPGSEPEPAGVLGRSGQVSAAAGMAAATVCGAAGPRMPVLMRPVAVLPWCHMPVPRGHLVLVDVAET